MQHLNWDNLRYVLMVANMGSISAAARELEVNRSTVLRRIGKFQQDLNCRIFERGEAGYVLTPEAEKMITAAREVENTLFNMQRQIAGHELKLEGELRVTTTDSFMLSVLGPHLASFRQKHPHIVVDLLVTNSVLDLDRRDADVAIRPTRQPDGNLVGRRLCDVEFGVYAAPGLLDSIEPADVFDARWIG
ncbi:MAG: LysR family transcriptional regulator, partial [Gammaproteobacteria bacterium]